MKTPGQRKSIRKGVHLKEVGISKVDVRQFLLRIDWTQDPPFPVNYRWILISVQTRLWKLQYSSLIQWIKFLTYIKYVTAHCTSHSQLRRHPAQLLPGQLQLTRVPAYTTWSRRPSILSPSQLACSLLDHSSRWSFSVGAKRVPITSRVREPDTGVRPGSTSEKLVPGQAGLPWGSHPSPEARSAEAQAEDDSEAGEKIQQPIGGSTMAVPSPKTRFTPGPLHLVLFLLPGFCLGCSADL